MPTDPVAADVLTVPGKDTGGSGVWALAEGTTLGRYRIDRLVGSGGMGEVYRARDVELERDVAIKLLARVGEAARVAVLAEAQAMAKLAHPNVVTVFEVIVEGQRVCLVMEYVDGTTLRRALEDRPARAEILRLFLEAGRGLAAAHEAGIVHRDFKPENVLVGADRRARVTDFGLASAPSQAGQSAGTPAYMAPEQGDGGAVDARADQFAFCVSLHEALVGARPFSGETAGQVRDRIRAGLRDEPPAWRALPARLRRTIVRGLAVDPDARFPDMPALLAALAHDEGARRRRLAVAGVVAVAIAVGTVGVVRGVRPGPTCGGAAEKLVGIWDAPVAGEVHAAFAASGRAYAEDTFTRVDKRLGDYAGAWRAMYRDACEASSVRGEQSPAVLDVRMACLDTRRRALGDLTAFLRRADGAVVERAAAAAAALPDVDACGDVKALTSGGPLPVSPALRARVAIVRAELATADVRFRIGDGKGAVALARTALAEAREIAYGSLQGEAGLKVSRLESDVEYNYAQSEQDLRAALESAAAAHDDRLEAEMWPDLILIVGPRLRRLDEGRSLETPALAALARAGEPPRPHARLEQVLGSLAVEAGDPKGAIDLLRRALAEAEQVYAPDDTMLAMSHNVLGIALRDAGQMTASREEFERGLAIFRQVYGPEHPRVLGETMNLATSISREGRPREALELFEKVLTSQERVLGPEHPDVARTLSNMTTPLEALGREDEAERLLLRALAIKEKVFGPDSPDAGLVLGNLILIESHLSHFEEALRYADRALPIFAKKFGEKSASVATIVVNRAWPRYRLGRFADARADFEHAAAVYEEAVGAEHPFVAEALLGLAAVARAEGKLDEIPGETERAEAIWRKLPDDHRDRARALVARGDALTALGHSEAARDALDRALAELGQSEGGDPPVHTDALTALAELLVRTGHPADAIARVEEALAIVKDQDPWMKGRLEYILSRALAGAKQDAARARKLAVDAETTLAGAGPVAKRDHDAAVAWLHTI
jgi:tetratricopeptide (TPR) repeat protein